MTDFALVEALARLQLVARRCGYRVIVSSAPDDVVELVEFVGLRDVVWIEQSWKPGEPELHLRLVDEGELDDHADNGA